MADSLIVKILFVQLNLDITVFRKLKSDDTQCRLPAKTPNQETIGQFSCNGGKFGHNTIFAKHAFCCNHGQYCNLREIYKMFVTRSSQSVGGKWTKEMDFHPFLFPNTFLPNTVCKEKSQLSDTFSIKSCLR